ncbi:MAG TPA: TlpA disulfide reductase family protein [Terriglobales bacterium]|nr:TlpA disulfide reductase family protein [Terriglobales bacterium]
MPRTWIAAALLALAPLTGCTARVQPGEPALDFHLTLNNGQAVSLASYRGRVVVLNFWASWCPPCIQETPTLNAMAERFPQGRLVVLGVSIDQDPVAYQNFLASYRIRYPTARDPSAALMHRYGTEQIPETYIINAEGRMVRKLVSATDWTTPDMLAYLRGLADAPAATAQRPVVQ